MENLIAEIGNIYFVEPANVTVIDIIGENPGFKVGDSISVEQGNLKFSAKISKITYYPLPYYCLTLDSGVDYMNGQPMASGGSVTKNTNITKYLLYSGIGLVVIIIGIIAYKIFKKK